MGAWRGGAWACRGLLLNLVRPLPHFPPHTPNAPLRPHNTLPGAVIGNTVGSSFKPTTRHEDRLQPN